MSNNWIPDEDPLIPLTVARAEDINRRYENVVSAMDRLPEPAASGKGFAPPVHPQDPANRQFVMSVLSSGEDAFVQANRAETEADRAESQANLADQHRVAALSSQDSATGSASTATAQAGIATTQAGIATTQAGNATTEADRARDEADRAESNANSVDPLLLTPQGIIVMWSGSVASIPTGWNLCDGTNGTPNLRDRFVVGAGSTYAVGATGGSANAVVVAHSHSASSGSAGSHSHTGSTNSTGAHTHSVRTHISTNVNHVGHRVMRQDTSSNTSAGRTDVSGAARSAGSHSHSLSINSNGSHTHSVSVNSSGESGSGKNLPPYYALAYIMKL